jgi:hypothetical protein
VMTVVGIIKLSGSSDDYAAERRTKRFSFSAVPTPGGAYANFQLRL